MRSQCIPLSRLDLFDTNNPNKLPFAALDPFFPLAPQYVTALFLTVGLPRVWGRVPALEQMGIHQTLTLSSTDNLGLPLVFPSFIDGFDFRCSSRRIRLHLTFLMSVSYAFSFFCLISHCAVLYSIHPFRLSCLFQSIHPFVY